MAEYIERRRLFNALADYWNIPHDWDGGISQPCEDALAFIENDPEADVVEVVHGRWGHGKTRHETVCSVFGSPRPLRKHKWQNPKSRKITSYPIVWASNYCPDCGARMDGE